MTIRKATIKDDKNIQKLIYLPSPVSVQNRHNPMNKTKRPTPKVARQPRAHPAAVGVITAFAMVGLFLSAVS